MSMVKPHSHLDLTACQHPLSQTQELLASPPPTPSPFNPQFSFSSADNSLWNPLPLPITCLIPAHPSRYSLLYSAQVPPPPEPLFSPPGEVRGTSLGSPQPLGLPTFSTPALGGDGRSTFILLPIVQFL